MKIVCPKCRNLIGAASLNVATDVGVCVSCEEVFAISSLVSGGYEVDTNFDIHAGPKGTSFQDNGFGWVLTASTRSPIAFFLVPFMCVWSGFSLGGIYGSQIMRGQFDLMASLFGIPFLLGTLFFGSIAVLAVCGRVQVNVDQDDGRVFVGVGPFGWTRRFDWATITAVEEAIVPHRRSGSNGFCICLSGERPLKFGSMLTDERRSYLLNALRQRLADRKDG